LRISLRTKCHRTYVTEYVTVTRNYSAETIRNANSLSNCIREPLNVIKNALTLYTHAFVGHIM